MMRGALRTFAPWLSRRARFGYQPRLGIQVQRWLVWVRERGAWIVAAQLTLTLVVLVHLALVLLFPGGRNQFLTVDLRESLPYLTLWHPGDAFGFPGESAPRSFIRYAVYAQNGQVQEGVFPNPQLKPNLRYSRWAAAGNVVSANDPVMHDTLLQYVLRNLRSSPLKLDLFAGQWEPGFVPPLPATGRTPASALTEAASDRARVWKLGTHDGLTQIWKPIARNGSK